MRFRLDQAKVNCRQWEMVLERLVLVFIWEGEGGDANIMNICTNTSSNDEILYPSAQPTSSTMSSSAMLFRANVL